MAWVNRTGVEVGREPYDVSREVMVTILIARARGGTG